MKFTLKPQFISPVSWLTSIFCLFLSLGFAMDTSAQSDAEIARADQIDRLRAAAGPRQSMDPAESTWIDDVRKAIKPYVIFNPDHYVGVSASVFQIYIAPDGQILNQTLLSSSGDLNWDKAALTAIEKTKYLPKNSRGVIPQRSVRISFYPK